MFFRLLSVGILPGKKTQQSQSVIFPLRVRNQLAWACQEAGGKCEGPASLKTIKALRPERNSIQAP